MIRKHALVGIGNRPDTLLLDLIGLARRLPSYPETGHPKRSNKMQIEQETLVVHVTFSGQAKSCRKNTLATMISFSVQSDDAVLFRFPLCTLGILFKSARRNRIRARPDLLEESIDLL